MRSNRWFALIAALVMVGCHRQNTVEHQMQALITTKCHGVWPCTINLRGATSFEWDKLYAFSDAASKADIENVTRTTLADYEEFSSYLVFQQAGKSIHIESVPTNVEHPIKNEVVFDMPDGAVYQAFPASTEFVVTQGSSEGGPFFFLKPK